MTLSTALLDFVRTRLSAGAAPGDLSEDTPLLSRGLIDSLGLTQLLAFIERETGLKVPDEEIAPENFENVAAINAMVERLGAQRG